MSAARRVKPSAAARIRPFWILIALAAVAILAAGVFFSLWSGFDPQSISVAGNDRVPAGEILTRARIAPNTSIWLMRPRAIAERIESIPWIATAQVHRFPPSTVRIDVTERVPYAIVMRGDRAMIADRSLRVLAPADRERLPELVLRPGSPLAAGEFVNSPDARELRDALVALAARNMLPAQLSFDRFGGLVAVMPDRLRLLFGDGGDFDRKLALVAAVIAQVVRGERRVAVIDVRAPSTPVVSYR